MKRIKLSQWAKENGVCYRTAYNYFWSGKIQGEQLHSGTILVENDDNVKRKNEKIVIYCRESSSENKSALENQCERSINFCNAKGWRVDKIVKEIGSGLNDKRSKFLEILKDKSITKIVVEHSDRFCRFGSEPIKTLLENDGRELFIINQTQDNKEDLIQDFISIITSFCARIYGQRRTKKATEKLIKEINETC